MNVDIPEFTDNELDIRMAKSYRGYIKLNGEQRIKARSDVRRLLQLVKEWHRKKDELIDDNQPWLIASLQADEQWRTKPLKHVFVDENQMPIFFVERGRLYYTTGFCINGSLDFRPK